MIHIDIFYIVTFDIIKYLDYFQINKLYLLNKHFKEYIDTNYIYSYLMKRDFKIRSRNPIITYKELYLIKSNPHQYDFLININTFCKEAILNCDKLYNNEIYYKDISLELFFYEFPYNIKINIILIDRKYDITLKQIYSINFNILEYKNNIELYIDNEKQIKFKCNIDKIYDKYKLYLPCIQISNNAIQHLIISNSNKI